MQRGELGVIAVNKETNVGIDVLWGAEAIGAAIGVNKRRAFHLLENRLIPAKRVGGRWAARRSELNTFFSGATSEAAG
jgi:hypothetical protein